MSGAVKRPVIAVVPLYDSERDSYWMLPAYMKGIERSGGIPVMLPLTGDSDTVTGAAEKADGYLFTGGQDISPSLYSAEKSEKCGELCAERDAMEQILMQYALEKDKPVLGICRGLQMLNVFSGGTLYQDIPDEVSDKIKHNMSPPYDRAVHSVTLAQDAPLFRLLGTDRLGVNSYHHQAVKRLSDKLRPMAYSDDGIVEAAYCPEKRFVWAVQWHPEFLYNVDINSRMIFQRFVSEASHT